MSRLFGITFLFCVVFRFVAADILVAQDEFGSSPFGDAEPTTGDMSGSLFGDPGNADDADAAGGLGIFGQPNTATTDTTTDGDSQVSDAQLDPVVRILRESPPKTPEDMANGLTWMTRLRNWGEAARLLDSIPSMNWNLNQKAQLARAAGPAMWMRLRSEASELSDAQRDIIRDIVRAPATLARNPRWIDSWIAKLGSNQPSERRLAQLRLQDSGSIGIEKIVEHLLAGDTNVPDEMLAGTLVVFGNDGINALHAACSIADPVRAARVVGAVADVPGRHFTAEIGAALASRSMPLESQQALANKLLAKYGSLPETAAIREFVNKEFANRLDAYFRARVSRPEMQTTLFRPTANGTSVASLEAPASHRELEKLTQAAVMRNQLKGRTRDDAVESASVMLQRIYQISTTSENTDRLLNVLDEQERTDVGFWEDVFNKATEWQFHGAAAEAMEMIAANASPASPPLNFLSDQLRDTRPIIRYAALSAIAKLDPQQPFRGSEQAVATAVEMTRLGDGPQALVIGLQSELRQVAQQQIQSQTGADVETSSSARSALLALDRGAPIELIFIVDRVSDQSLFELIQRLRNSRGGQSLPIAVLTDDLYSHERRIIGQQGGVVSGVLSRNASNMTRVIESMYDMLDTEPMTLADRASFAMKANQFLSRIVADRETYAFYPISDWRSELTNLVSTEPSSQPRLLSGLGTRDSQRSLFAIAASTNNGRATRIEAAKSFGMSVKRFGMQLDRQDILEIYEAYNRFGPTDPASVGALGFFLDVIEAQAGKAEWPQGL